MIVICILVAVCASVWVTRELFKWHAEKKSILKYQTDLYETRTTTATTTNKKCFKLERFGRIFCCGYRNRNATDVSCNQRNVPVRVWILGHGSFGDLQVDSGAFCIFILYLDSQIDSFCCCYWNKERLQHKIATKRWKKNKNEGERDRNGKGRRERDRDREIQREIERETESTKSEFKKSSYSQTNRIQQTKRKKSILYSNIKPRT